MVQQVPDVILAAREEIVDADDVVPLAEEKLGEMAAQKARPSGYQILFTGRSSARKP